MKPGITYAYLARLFLKGHTMTDIARRCQCDRLEVENAIWKVMVREARKRK